VGVYYKPVSDIRSERRSVVERVIHTYDHDQAKVLMPSDCHLYALCDNGLFQLAACVDEREEFNEFLRQFEQGYLLSFELVALSPEAHQRALRDAGL